MELQKQIGQAIKKERERQGLTIEQFAKMMGKSTTTIYRYEEGRHAFTSTTLSRIASALSCSVEVILKPKSG